MALIDVTSLLDADLAAEFVDPLSNATRRMMLMQVQTLRNQKVLLSHFEAASLSVKVGSPVPKSRKRKQ